MGMGMAHNVQCPQAAGPDGVPNWFLRDFAPFLSVPLCAIYNASVREGSVPAVWKSAEVIPIPKVKPPRDIQSDLQPISLLSTAAKVLESFIRKWILEAVASHLDPYQFACGKVYTARHSCTFA